MFDQDGEYLPGRGVGPQVISAQLPLFQQLFGAHHQALGRLARILKLGREPLHPGVEFAEAEPGQARQVTAGVPCDEDADGGRDGDAGAMGGFQAIRIRPIRPFPSP